MKVGTSWQGLRMGTCEMATHFNILAWRIPWTEESGGLEFRWSQKNQHNLAQLDN